MTILRHKCSFQLRDRLLVALDMGNLRMEDSLRCKTMDNNHMVTMVYHSKPEVTKQ